jgi:hypothetical protein
VANESVGLPSAINVVQGCKADVDVLRQLLSECEVGREENPLEWYRSTKVLVIWCAKGPSSRLHAAGNPWK